MVHPCTGGRRLINRFETKGNHGLLVFAENDHSRGFLGAGFRPSTAGFNPIKRNLDNITMLDDDNLVDPFIQFFRHFSRKLQESIFPGILPFRKPKTQVAPHKKMDMNPIVLIIVAFADSHLPKGPGNKKNNLVEP